MVASWLSVCVAGEAVVGCETEAAVAAASDGATVKATDGGSVPLLGASARGEETAAVGSGEGAAD